MTPAEAAQIDETLAAVDLLGYGEARPWLVVARTIGVACLPPCVRTGRPEPWRRQRHL